MLRFLAGEDSAGKGKTCGKADFEFRIICDLARAPAPVGCLPFDADVAILFGILIATLQKTIAY